MAPRNGDFDPTQSMIPDWLAEALDPAAPVDLPQVDPAAPLSTPATIARAAYYLLREATPAVQGSGGDAHTLAVAMRVKDFGVTAADALDLMSRCWNEECSPPWPLDDLRQKVANAYRYGRSAPGSASPLADFSAAPGNASLLPQALVPFLLSSLPRRQWLLGTLIVRGRVSLLIAPPGAGKTTFLLQAAIGLAAGRSDICGLAVRKRCRVWYWNQEDDHEELRRRVAAIMQHFGVDWTDLDFDGRPALYLNSGVDHPLALARRVNGRIVAGDGPALIAAMLAAEIDVFIVDPLSELHTEDENDNGAMRAVLALARDIAVQAKVGLCIAHHTRKPPAAGAESHAGNMDSARGAGAILGVVRAAATLYSGMGDADGRAFGVAEDERRRFVRLDDAKGNMSFDRQGKPLWLERIGVELGGLGGEEVGVLAPRAFDTVPRRQAQVAFAADLMSVAKPGMTVARAAQAMAENFQIYDAQDLRVLQKRITRTAADGVAVDGWRFVVEKISGKSGQEYRLRIAVE